MSFQNLREHQLDGSFFLVALKQANQQEEYERGGAMSTILRRICEVEVENNFILYLHIGLANQHKEYGRGRGIQNNLEMYRNLKGRYVIHISSTKSQFCLGLIFQLMLQ